MISMLQLLPNNHPNPKTAALQKLSGGNLYFVLRLDFESGCGERQVPVYPDSSKVELSGDEEAKACFKGYILDAKEDSEEGAAKECRLELEPFTFEILAQLRPEYANRILQFTGHYLSRIGIDFISQTH